MQKQIILLMWHTAMRYKTQTFLAAFGSAATTIVGSFYGPYLIGDLLNQLQSQKITLHSALPLIVIYGLTQIYGQIVGWRLNLFWIWNMEVSAQQYLHHRIFSNLTHQSMTFHADRFGGALVSQTTKLVGAFEKFWDTMVFQIIPMVASVVAAVVILSFMFWQYAFFLFILSLLFIIVVILGSRFLIKRNKEEAQANTAITAFIADALTNITTIKAYGHEHVEANDLNKRTNEWYKKSLATMRGFLAVSSAYSFLISVINIVALIGVIWASEHHLIPLGTVYIVITYTFAVGRQLWDMNSIMRNYNRIMGDANDMTEILELVPDITDTSSTKLKVEKGMIAFTNATFTHNGDSDTLFNDFSLTIKEGERIGLVGRSGSGKTTLVRLLLRFIELDSGTITIDSQNIAAVTQQSLHQAIAYVPQEPMLFHRSLRENIAYGKLNASEEEIIEAARQANALDFIEKLPQGFDTLVGERGVKLSGGQRQRIAIARAILKNAPILVLDEATSALDSESEKLIQQALEKLMKNRTSIVIAHRLSTIASMDQIVVLDNGTIAEQGTHNELLEQKGVYAKLWSHQSGGFIEE
jgi:ATP-binding cassette, subfamily B, bacterial